LVVRQASPLWIGIFLTVVVVAMGGAALHDPGPTLGSGNGFLDRWFFGVLVVPLLWGLDRFLLRPRVCVDQHGVHLHNPLQTIEAPWPAVLGAGFDRRLQLALADGDLVFSIIFGPALSSPVTRRTRVDQLVEVVNRESAQRSGREYGLAEPIAELIAIEALEYPDEDPDAPEEPPKPGARLRPAYGLVNLAVYAVGWTLACALAAKHG
jgi:hypothetical protein